MGDLPTHFPVPLKAIVCGEPLALSVIVMDAVSAPVVVGARWPWMVQFAPTARLVPQVLANTNEDAFAPASVMLVIVNAAVPLFVIVTDCELLEVPTVVAGKEMLVAESVTGATPVPLSAIDCGDVLALSVMVTVAFNAPAAVGAKCPWMVQFAPTARLVPQELAKTNEEAFVPVTAMLPIDRAAVPVLVIVTDCELPDRPTSTEPKERLVAERVTGGFTPVPVKAILSGDPEPV